LATVLLLAAGACTSGDDGSLADRVGGGSSSGGLGGGGGEDGEDGSGLPQPGLLFSGLAQYDSYRMSFGFNGSGGDTAPISQTVAVDYSAAEGGWRAVTTSVDEFGETVQDAYWKGGAGCSNDGSGWVPLEFGLEERDLFGALWAGFDILFKVRSPEFVGDETFEGTAAEHYTAAIAGLGAASGAVPTESRVDYWLAKDGGALIGYQANIETSTGPAADPASDVVRLEITMRATDLDQPVSITPPPECPVGTEAAGGSSDAGELTVLPGLAETLGLYDSYRFAVDGNFGSPSFGSSQTTLQVSVARDGSFNITTTAAAEGETSTQEVYWDGETLCQYDGFEWTAEALADEQSQLPGALGLQLDLVPVVRGAEKAGSETVAGVETTRYTFPVAGVGPGTATVANGEFWLTDDGQMLRYRVNLSSVASDGTVIDGDLTLSLDDLNADIAVTLPAECADAALSSGTIDGEQPPPTGEAGGSIQAFGPFEASESFGADQILCFYDNGLFTFDVVTASGLSAYGVIFNTPLSPGEVELDEISVFGPLGTPPGDAATVFERFGGGPGLGYLLVESMDGSQLNASFSADLSASDGAFDPVVVSGNFTCPLTS
jgi:hypothetical protein